MRQKILMTENEVRDIITEAVEQTISDEQNNQILMGIAEAITNLGTVPCYIGENELYNQIHIGEYNVDIDYTVESDSYYSGGDDGDYYNAPQPSDFNEGEVRVTVSAIYVNSDEGDDLMDIEDTGIIANALASVIEINDTEYPRERNMDPDDDMSGYDDSWS